MNEKEVNAEKLPPQQQDAFTLELILAKRPELFCDIRNQPRIRLPPVRDHPAEEPWSIRSPRVRAWIAELFCNHSKRLLRDREIDRILNVLEGKAWQDRRQDLDLNVAVEEDSLLEAILLFMERETRFEGTVTMFQRDLVKAARKAGLETKHWPKGSPQLSNRIRNLEHWLLKAGITVERTRDSYERRIIVKREVNDGPASPPSQAPSVDKSHHPKTVRRNDAADPEKRAEIFARLSKPTERTDNESH